MGTRRDDGPAWIDFPPLWPERGQARDGDPETAEERPAVVLTTAIPDIGRRERPRVLRIVSGVRTR